jgi:hypothetical protein
MHLPNGSFTTFGGNGAIGPGGNLGSVPYPNGASAQYDDTYKDYDGTRAFVSSTLAPVPTRISSLNPSVDGGKMRMCCRCRSLVGIRLLKPLADGTITLIGGFVNGGYINRNYPNTDPAYEGGAAEPTVEFYPSKATPRSCNS